MVDLDGIMYYNGMEQQILVKDRAYFQKALQGQSSVESYVAEDGSSRTMVISVPIYRDGEIQGLVLGQYTMDELEHLMSIRYFNGEGYNYITDSKGEVLVHSAKGDARQNVLEDLKHVISRDFTAPDLEKFADNMQKGENGYIRYQKSGEDFILEYTATGINDWYLLLVVPCNVVDVKTRNVIDGTAFYCVFILLVLGLMAFGMLNGRRKNHRQIRRAYENIRSIYRTVPSAIVRFRLDDKLSILDSNDGFYQFMEYTMEDYEERYGRFLQPVLRGGGQGMVLKLKEGTYLQRIFDSVQGRTAQMAYGNFDVQMQEGALVVQCAFIDISRQMQQLSEGCAECQQDPLTAEE